MSRVLPTRRFSSKTTSTWIKDHLSDPYVKQARLLNYRTRAAFKLIEMDQRYNLLRKPGMRVLELGAAPGGWTQVLQKQCDRTAHVLAIDLEPMDMLQFTENSPSIEIMQGDITRKETVVKIHRHFSLQRVDLILSDIATDLTGDQHTDDSETRKLNYAILEIASSLLKPSGTLLLKSFMHEGEKNHIRAFEMQFGKVLRIKPDASRKNSNEIYYLCQGYQNTEFYKMLKRSKTKVAFNEVYKHFSNGGNISEDEFQAVVNKMDGKTGAKSKEKVAVSSKEEKKSKSTQHTTLDDLNLKAAEPEHNFFEKWAKNDKLFKDLLSGPLTLEEAVRQVETTKRLEKRKAKDEEMRRQEADITKGKLLDLEEELAKFDAEAKKKESAEEAEEENDTKKRPLTKAEKLLLVLGKPQTVNLDKAITIDQMAARDSLNDLNKLEKQLTQKEQEKSSTKEYEYFLSLYKNDEAKLKKIKDVMEADQERRMEDKEDERFRAEDEILEMKEKEEEEEEYNRKLDYFSREAARYEKIANIKGNRK